MKTLQLYNLESVDHIVSPIDFDDITLKSPAIDILTDFKRVKPLVIDADTKAIDAHIFMERAHVSLKLVIDKNGEFLGIISLDDLSDEKLIRRVSLGIDRDDILVCDLMTSRNKIYALDFEELAHSWVIDIIETLKKNGLKHCLVVDHQSHEIRGVLLASEIARRLRISFEPHKPPSFAEIFTAVHK